jgi:hypothetical protein
MHVTGRMPAIEIAYSTRRGVKTLAGLNITDGGSICTSKGGSIQFSAEVKLHLCIKLCHFAPVDP